MTPEAYRRLTSSDPTLSELLHPIYVDQLDPDDTLSVLRAVKERFELHHRVRISDGALVSATMLSRFYIADRAAPAKEIDLIDEVAARKRLAIDNRPEQIDEVNRRLTQLRIEEGSLKMETDQASRDRLGRLRRELAELEERSYELSAQWQAGKDKLALASKLKDELERLRNELDVAQRRGDFEQAGRIAYGELPQAQKALEEAEALHGESVTTEEVRSDDVRRLIANIAGKDLSEIEAAEAGLAIIQGGECETIVSKLDLYQPSDRAEHAGKLYHSCFMSYATEDYEFAEKLFSDLIGEGVRCWFAPEHMKIGSRILESIHLAIGQHDKLLLVLSDASVNSEWVEVEFMRAFAEEKARKKTIIFPVQVDDAVTNSSKAWAQMLRAGRHIGDFSRWENQEAYQRALTRLLRDLTLNASE